jgi:hypothetical protein
MGILEFIIVGLVIFWLLGFFFHIAGKFIHLLLIIAVILIIAGLLGFHI